MAIKKVKKRDYENLTDTNISKVISLLEAAKPITKKEACEILNISYNTTRLGNIIEGFKTRKEVEARMKATKRGKPASNEEICDIIEQYLKGVTISDISKSLYRSSSFVSAVIDRVGVPRKPTGDDRAEVSVLPDQCIAEEFKPGQRAWSAVYHAPCEIKHEVTNKNYEDEYASKCYSIYVFESLDEVPEFYPNITVGGFNAYSTAANLGSLEHLVEYGVRLDV